MANPLYQEFKSEQNAFGPFGNLQNFMKQLNQLKQTGIDPNQKIQEMLNSGQISQAQYNAAVQRAQQIQQMMGGNHQNGS